MFKDYKSLTTPTGHIVDHTITGPGVQYKDYPAKYEAYIDIEMKEFISFKEAIIDILLDEDLDPISYKMPYGKRMFGLQDLYTRGMFVRANTKVKPITVTDSNFDAYPQDFVSDLDIGKESTCNITGDIIPYDFNDRMGVCFRLNEIQILQPDDYTQRQIDTYYCG